MMWVRRIEAGFSAVAHPIAFTVATVLVGSIIVGVIGR